MIVALYTSRKILETLGVDDFGIFNVVGGIISLMSFINGSMSVATQRYLTYELGRGTEGQFNKVFNMAVYIHAIIAVIVLIAAETVGVWFVNTQLNIPEVRMEAANWVFQATILTTILGILQTPYNAAIISHEHMHVYAYVGLGKLLPSCLLFGDFLLSIRQACYLGIRHISPSIFNSHDLPYVLQPTISRMQASFEME